MTIQSTSYYMVTVCFHFRLPYGIQHTSINY